MLPRKTATAFGKLALTSRPKLSEALATQRGARHGPGVQGVAKRVGAARPVTIVSVTTNLNAAGGSYETRFDCRDDVGSGLCAEHRRIGAGGRFVMLEPK